MFLLVFVNIVILNRPFKIDQKHVLVSAINFVLISAFQCFSAFNCDIWKINIFAISFFGLLVLLALNLLFDVLGLFILISSICISAILL